MALQENLDYEMLDDDDDDDASDYNPESAEQEWGEMVGQQMVPGQSLPQQISYEAMYGMTAGHFSPQYMSSMMNYQAHPENYYGQDPKVKNGIKASPDTSNIAMSSAHKLNNVKDSHNSNSISGSSSNAIHDVQNHGTKKSYSNIPSIDSSITAAFATNHYPNKAENTYSSPVQGFNQASFSNNGSQKSVTSKSPYNIQITKNSNTVLHHQTDVEQHKRNSKTASVSHNSHGSAPYSVSNKTDMNRAVMWESGKTNKPNSQDFIHKLTQARNELKNLRQSVQGLRSQHKKDVSHIEDILHYGSKDTISKEKEISRKKNSEDGESKKSNDDTTSEDMPHHWNPIFKNWKPIGYMESSYLHKNGTPRQGCLVKESRGRIRIVDALYNNPHHSLHGLQQYSHVWLIFVFDQNSKDPDSIVHTKAKVAPPRLGGAKLGVFATRSPHRPNPIGITLAKLDSVEGSSVHVSGIDILYGTPILDIKPYIPEYDSPSLDEDITREDVMRCVKSSSVDGDNACDGDKHTDASTKSACDSMDGSYLSIGKTTEGEGARNNSKHKSNVVIKSNGIVITKLTSTQSYSHLIEKVSKLKTNTESLSSTSLTTSEQLRNAAMEDKVIAELKLAGNSTGSGSGVYDERHEGVRTPAWLKEADANSLQVVINPIAEDQIKRFSRTAEDPKYRLQQTADSSSLRQVILSTARSDPRSLYRRSRCPDVLHRWHADAGTVLVTAVFLPEGVMEILRVTPTSGLNYFSSTNGDAACSSAIDVNVTACSEGKEKSF